MDWSRVRIPSPAFLICSFPTAYLPAHYKMAGEGMTESMQIGSISIPLLKKHKVALKREKYVFQRL